MEQIQFLKYKIDGKTLTLYLKNKYRVVVWRISGSKVIHGHVSKIRCRLRRSLYDLAYEFTSDGDERNVIMDALWFILYDDVSRYVWVQDGFLEKIDKKYND